MSGPRPQFITPYRKQEAGREVSPLARCSSSSLPLSGLSEVRGGVDIVEPSSKKLRISAPNSTSDTKNGPRGTASKVSFLHNVDFFIDCASRLCYNKTAKKSLGPTDPELKTDVTIAFT